VTVKTLIVYDIVGSADLIQVQALNQESVVIQCINQKLGKPDLLNPPEHHYMWTSW